MRQTNERPGQKRLDRICAAVTILTLILTGLFMNGEALGLQKVVDEDAESYAGDTVFTANDLNGDWDTSSAAVITLDGEDGTVSGNGAYFLDGNLVISSAGTYVISGELSDGYISVNVETSDAAKVWILLDGVTLSCSDNACFRVEQADKVFLTLAEGSENSMTSGAEYCEEALEEGTGGTIFSRDDLTINGSGSLFVSAEYKHGLDVNDSLTITGGTITVTCPQDAMHVNDALDITGADITINAGDDGIHSDESIGIYGGTILLESCYEGFEAPQILVEDGEITICASDDGINANGGSDSSGFGMMMGGGQNMQGPAAAVEAGAEGTAAEEAGAEGHGTEGAAAAEEAGAEGTAAEDAEDTPTVTINGGNITILNENGMDADGIDSNGDIIINGGTVLVSMGNTGGNNGLDYGSENGGSCIINGGTVTAAAGSSLVEGMSSASEQCSIMYVLAEEAAAGSTAVLTDADGNVIYSQEIPYSFSSLVISCADMVPDETCTLTIENEGEEICAEEITLDSTAVTVGSAAGGMDGRMGQRGGGQMPQNGQMPEDGQMPEMMTGDGRMPEMPQMMGQNGQMPEMPQGGQMPQMTTEDGQMPEMTTEDSQMAEMTTEDGQMPEMRGDGQNFRQDMGGGQERMQEAEADTAAGSVKTIRDYDSSTWILLLASAAVLIGGLIFAGKYH